jgi:predicted dehydrogenase
MSSPAEGARLEAPANEVGIGIIGYGMMGKAHSYGYTLAPHIRRLRTRPRLRLISGRNRDAVQRAAELYGVPRAVTDWRELIESPAVDIVDICTPPGTHSRPTTKVRRAPRARSSGPTCATPSALITGACPRCRS